MFKRIICNNINEAYIKKLSSIYVGYNTRFKHKIKNTNYSNYTTQSKNYWLARPPLPPLRLRL